MNEIKSSIKYSLPNSIRSKRKVTLFGGMMAFSAPKVWPTI